MIQFTCKHCRQPVRVNDAHGGKMGRCPHCKQLVAIPGPPDALHDLAAALTAGQAGENDDTSVGLAPPPPPVDAHALDEEFQLPEETNEELADTVILPAECVAVAEPPAPAPPDRRLRFPHERRRSLNPKAVWLIIAATIVVLAAAGVGLYILVRLQGR